MEWMSILKCPITGNDLRALQEDELKLLNEKIRSKAVWQADGKPMEQSINKGLITADGAYIYPIIKEIVLLLKDLAVVDSKDKLISDTINADKQLVKNFYDQKGWFTDEAGNYEDAVIYEDLREVSKIGRAHV